MKIGRSKWLAAIGVALLSVTAASGQTAEKGPWWPSPFGAQDQAGNSNYITPEKILTSLKLAKTGKIYELGHIYDAKMPAFGDRPYVLLTQPANEVTKADQEAVHTDYFTGFLGHMGTQFDGLGHMGRALKMPDGSYKAFFYNGYTEADLTGPKKGAGGVEKLGVEQIKPIITRGLLVDIAGYKGVATLDARYEVTLADVLGALKKEGLSEDSIQPGDAVLLNFGWAANWDNPSKYNDGHFWVGENKGSPGINHEVAKWMVSKKVSIVGADTCCVMMMPQPEGDAYNLHVDLLPYGVFLMENLDLRELAKDKAYEFLYLNLTERLRGATGSPVRPIAIR
ncbi:cyclase family protein [Novosphingobium humi]|uniref:Cyclase family protein n=1 Tax=Novosphingobium humi TaxID=2282397 RepID=A0ABY7U126_9SPHN|nr:cyclase family protein [Novosphingobium humi]WCT79220.1 cyclase family protein [Novosphingobium humi]